VQEEKSLKTACRITFSLLTVLVLMFIFGNSAADGENSSELSLLVTQWINSCLSGIGIPLELPHAVVRKLDHFTEYSVLGALLVMTVWAWCRAGVRWKFSWVWIALVCGLCTACLDEYLQTFVPQRCGSPADAALDFCGILWAASVVSALLARGRRQKKIS